MSKTIEVLQSHKTRNNRNQGIFGYGTPYISAYYNWFVLGNMTLSNKKIEEINYVFFDQPMKAGRKEWINNGDVNITNISSNSEFDEHQQVWKSWIDIEITNQDDRNWNKEYITNFQLPSGCWISNYYLYVGDQKEYGIMAEKKAAQWIFNQIKSKNRDPGILYYLNNNTIAFRIFPFQKQEVRKTGIQLIHKEPFTFEIDDHQLELGKPDKQADIVSTQNAIYIPWNVKSKLETVQRKPYFHFIVDASASSESNRDQHYGQIEKLLQEYPALQDQAQISFVNNAITTFPIEDYLQNQTIPRDFSGGFNLDRAIRKVLINAKQDDHYPIIVVISDNMGFCYLNKDFSDLMFNYPESEYFYWLGETGLINEHSLVKNSMNVNRQISSIPVNHSVYKYRDVDGKNYFLPKNKAASIVLKDNNVITPEEITSDTWEGGLIMQSQWMERALHPKAFTSNYLTLVKNSFTSNIMTPATAFLVVENEAQKQMLYRKQQQVLNSNQALDLDDETQRMSEPSMIWLVLLVMIFLLWRNRKGKSLNMLTVKS